MKYRKLGKNNLKLPILGLGCMRLPIEKKNNNFENKSINLINYATKCGINYYDTAYTYNNGRNESLLGKAIKKMNRKNIVISTKLPMWKVKNLDNVEKIIEEQLKRLKTNYIDMYLLHALNKGLWEKTKNLNVINKILEYKRIGLIRYIGFSFHDDYNIFHEIINYFDWDFCQIQYNYMNENFQAGIKGIELAASKGIGIIIMEPLLGGKLANPPERIKKIIYENNYSPVEFALKWLWQNNLITSVLSGMTDIQQIDKNISFSNSSEKHINKDIISRIQNEYSKRNKINCTECKYCIPCDKYVNIPKILNLYNESRIYGTERNFENEYKEHIRKNTGADKCVYCQKCEIKCPQNIRISEIMKELNDIIKQ